MRRLRALAPGKVNPCLYVGPRRGDGYHEVVTLIDSVDLCDLLTIEETPGDEADSVVCPGVEGENLAARALAAFRELTGWDGPSLRLTIEKRIPVAAGMAGGSADAAAALRLAEALTGLAPPAQLPAQLGADVPSQMRPGLALARGFGDRVDHVVGAPERAYVVLPAPFELSTAAVFGELDRAREARDARGLADAERAVGEALERGELPAPCNDLAAAAVRLAPAVADALDALGDDHDGATVSGSGPTVYARFVGPAAWGRAQAAAERLPGAIACRPVAPGAGRVEVLAA